MSEQLDFTELVERAQQGDKRALDQLAEQAVKRLHVYVYRLTLQEDLTQEIVQETLLEMVKILGKLKRSDRFLPWLYGIATNKLRHYYRSEATLRKATSMRADQNGAGGSPEEGLENLLSRELRDIIMSAIQGLKTRHRAVLIMRCYDGMSYAEIAESMGTTEFGTRMLFIRAKKALQKQLSRSGLGKGSLLAVLTLFGKMTAPTKVAAAEISVTAATTQAGVLATAAGAALSKTAVVTVTAGALAVGTAVGPMQMFSDRDELPQASVAGLVDTPLQNTPDTLEKNWFYLPDGVSGPLTRRSQSDTQDNVSKYVILQNGQGNYYYDGETIHINNYRAWNMRVLRLPTDSVAMTQFLNEMEGLDLPARSVPAPGQDILVVDIESLQSPGFVDIVVVAVKEAMPNSKRFQS